MTLHYLVIWMIGSNMSTREETPLDLEVSNPDQDDADKRYETIKSAIAESFDVDIDSMTVINICKL